MRAAGLLILALALGACGGSAPRSRVGVTDAEPEATPVELELRTPEGVPIFLGDLRGKPVLLFVFATWDGVSQASLRPLSRFVRAHPDVHVIGVAMQPDAEQLLDAWAYALSPPFTVAFDPRERLSTGTSDLGVIDTIPTYILLDIEGFEVERHVGYAGERKLDRMLYRAGERVRPRSAGEPPPLVSDRESPGS